MYVDAKKYQYLEFSYLFLNTWEKPALVGFTICSSIHVLGGDGV